MSTTTDTEPVWVPNDELLEQSRMATLMRSVGADDYNALWQWSVEDLSRFWRRIWDMFDIDADGDPARVLVNAEMPGAQFFPDVALSFAEHAFRGRIPARPAIHAVAESGELTTWSWGRLAEETSRVRVGLQALGVQRGDRVVGYLPNVPETIAAFLATASLGAVWACCSPDFGSRAVVDRLQQLEPTVLLAVSGYRFNGRHFDRRDAVDELKAQLPTLKATIELDRSRPDRGEWDSAFPHTSEPLSFERVPFDHPLWIVFSSGTTGLPKAIVHGHGGILLEQLKLWPLHHDTSDDDVVFWYTTTGWVMWNLVVGGLATGCTVVLYDGSPTYPDIGALWDIVERVRATIFGVGAAYLHSCLKHGVAPTQGRDLSRLRGISSSGSPLAPEAYHWVRQHFGADVFLSSSSGGTDIAGGFVGGTPLSPVYPGELPARMLGVAVESWDDNGQPLVDQVGELVVTAPMPSMPTKFWNDPDGHRYRDSYFSTFPGVWRHGDWIRITPRGSAVIYGRSDSTINRGGVRMGTAEIYAAVTAIPQVQDALVIDVPADDGIGVSTMRLFVALPDGQRLEPDLEREIRDRIRRECSPRHVPDIITVAPEVPRTLSGKVLEVPVKRLFMGSDPDKVASRDSLANPGALDWFVDFATRTRAAT